jgi:penicillin-binding protein 1A
MSNKTPWDEGSGEPNGAQNGAPSQSPDDAPPSGPFYNFESPSRPSPLDGFAAGQGSAKSSPEQLARQKRSKLRRLILIYPLATVLVASVVGVVVAASIHQPQIAELDQFKPRLVTEIHDRDGRPIRTYSRENRILIEEGQLPKLLQDAILATEDAHFFQHGGVDLEGILRAAVTNFRAGRVKEGASTITMQLARELFQLSREQDIWRKVEEALLAVELEKNYSKEQILTLYANMVNLGHGNYGMEAGARAFFNKSVADLTLAEAASLAGIPQRPTHFSLYRRPEEVKKRRNWVLQRMETEGYITAAEREAAQQEEIVVAAKRRDATFGLHFSEEVRRHLITTFGETQLYDRGLLVRTTLDPKIQTAAEKALRDQLLALDHRKGWRGNLLGHRVGDLEQEKLASWAEAEVEKGEFFEGLVLSSGPTFARVKYREQVLDLSAEGVKWTGRKAVDELLKPGDVAYFRWHQPKDKDKKGNLKPAFLRLEQEPKLEAAVLVIESTTGAVRALVGGWNYERNEFNRVTQAHRQVGSAFKPFVYGAALEQGYTPADTIFDGPAIFAGGDGLMSYSPRNYYRKFYGIITLRRALELSVNVASVKLMMLVGVDRTIDLARRCGITSDLPPYPSLALGSADLIPLEMAAAYATFANQGVYVEPYMIERIVTRSGKTLEEHQPRARKAMEPQTAFVLSMMLKGVAERGTAAGHLANLPIATAGKTGTTNDYTDAWFIGYTPRYTILTWVGYDQKRSIGRGMTGAEAALPIWQAVVERGLEDGWLREGEEFAPPPGVSATEVDAKSGLLWAGAGEKKVLEYFVAGTEPKKSLDGEAARVMQLPWYLQEGHYLPKEGELMPGQIEDRDRELINKAWEGVTAEAPEEEGEAPIGEGEIPPSVAPVPPPPPAEEGGAGGNGGQQ